MSRLCGQKLVRLQAIVAERANWAEPLAQVKRLHGWLLEVEHLLDRSRASEGEVVNNVTVGIGLDHWRERMNHELTDGSLSQLEQEGLREFLQVLTNLRPYIWCSATTTRTFRAPTMTWSAAFAASKRSIAG